MIRILKKASEYTLDEFKTYCETNGINFSYYIHYMKQWAIQTHEVDFRRFIKLAGPSTVVTVSGSACLDSKHYKFKPRTFSLSTAFDKMLTPDVQDFCISLGSNGDYYVFVSHCRGHNVFKFRLDDKN